LRLLREMLEACYFTVERTVFLSEDRMADRLALSPRDELLKLAANAVKARQRGEAPQTSESRDRVFLILRPVRNENRHHRYKPPFGLHRFDTRTF
jgi:hypothetical protein